MMKTDKNFIKRCVLMAVGILFIGICVGAFRLSAFGVDAFTCMNLGISVFFTARRCIGAGTIVNMVGVGYMADFICWLFQEVWEVNMTLPLRILALVTGSLLAGIGVAFYMAAEMGIAPYDSVALIIEKGTNGKIKFQYARVLSDITVVIVGVAFCLLSGGDLRLIIGIGTVCNALFNGPLIQFFKVHAAEPLLKK